MKRLPTFPTQRINTERMLSFTYADKNYQGIEGDTIATALFANGVKILSRSLKYHRPRGLYSMDGETSNSLMSVNGEPNICAEMV
ncbi:MAG: hypothetical protein GXP38_10620, partial [Chloroflexi bacterium]|nr:hypothetical protein [Chloroflexota bacterium]